MFCTNCGTKLEDGVKFCYNCGCKVEVSPDLPAEAGNQLPVEAGNQLPAVSDSAVQQPAAIGSETLADVNSYDSEKTIVISSVPIRDTLQHQNGYTVDAEAYYEDEPGYDKAPVYNDAPRYDRAPDYNDAPAYNRAPVYNDAPAYDRAPDYNDAPFYNDVQDQEDYVPEYIKPKKKIAKIIIPVAGVVAIAGLAVFAGPKILGAIGSGSSPVAFVSGKDYMLANKINGKKTKTLDIVKTKYENSSSDANYKNTLLQFGKDGKYMFFLTKYDEYEGTGTLNFAQCSKLKADTDKNEKYIENIDSDVAGFKVISTSEAVYRTGDYDLYYFDGKEKHQIHKEVHSYMADQKGNIIYSVIDEDDGSYTFYAVTTKDISDSRKLMSGVTDYYVPDYDSLDKILLSKRDDDTDTLTLYECGYSIDDPNKIASNVTACQIYNKKVYISLITDKKSSYDLIDDSYVEKDKDLKKPEYEDYQVPYYDYYKISDTSKSYSEMYTSVSNSCSWFDKGWYYSSMLDSVDNSSYSDGVRSAVQAFIDKYEEKQDQQGYLLVTAEVMKDLQAINSADSSKKNNDWVKLCFTREEDGTTTDYDAYEKAYNKYEEASGRIYARETLQDPANDYPVYSLLKYSGGSVSTIADNIAFINWSSGCIQYNTLDMITEKIAIEEYQGLSQVREILGVNYTTQPIYIINTDNDQTSQFGTKTCESIEDISENGTGLLSVTSDQLYYKFGEEIYSAPIEKNIIGSFDEISDDTGLMRVVNDKLYYADEPYTSHKVVYGDIHCINKGKDEVVAKDVCIDDLCVYEDDMLLYSTDGDMDSSKGCTLAVRKTKGEEIELGDDVTQFIRINDKHVYFISNNDLYDFNGKDSERVISDVDYFWTPDKMKYTAVSLD